MDVKIEMQRLRQASVIAEQAMRRGASQDLGELAEAILLVSSLKPETIVELGCDRGGTLYAWRQFCDRVFGITWADNADSSGAVCATYGASVRGGDTHDPRSLTWLMGQLDDLIDVLVIDGDHHLEGIKQDLSMYGSLVRTGGLIMMHDIRPTCFPEVDVWKIWPKLREMYQTTEIGQTYGWGIIHVRTGDDFTRVQA